MSLVKSARPYEFAYHTIRNVSCPEDVEADRKVLFGHAPASSFLNLEDNENVREYLVDLPGKQKRSPTLVHQAIRGTLQDKASMFSILNGGICIVARNAEVDEKGKIAKLIRPSIINGSQTQGELRRYFGKHNQSPPFDPSVTFELIVTDDDDLIAEISIARNFQNDVRPISIAGRRGQLDELEAALQREIPELQLRKSESQVSDDFEDTEKLIQVLFVLSPDAIWEMFPENERIDNKAATYSQKTRFLKLFQRVAESVAKDDAKPEMKELYAFFLDMAAPALRLYKRWQRHQGFIGTKLRAIERDDKGKIERVPDGIIFPILGSYSSFVRKEKGRWQLAVPAMFEEKMLIEAAAQDYQNIAGSDPQKMGKSKACYFSLQRITSIYAKFA
jgi:hypothetical protein